MLKKITIGAIAALTVCAPVWPGVMVLAAENAEEVAIKESTVTEIVAREVDNAVSENDVAQILNDGMEPLEGQSGEEMPPLFNNTRQAAQVALSADVDMATGAFSYSFDMDIAPGRNGMQPDMKLSYSSHSRDNENVYGFGWSLNLPEISRLNKSGTNNLYNQTNFRSSLSGELVSIDLSDGVHGIYAPRVEKGDFLKYEFLTDDSWKVTNKYGEVYLFGVSANARLANPSDVSQVFSWKLEERRDTNDNYVRYVYTSDNGQLYPSQITYTGNGITDGPFSVDLTFVDRQDPVVDYSRGFRVETNKILSKIEGRIEGALVHEYTFGYAVGDNQSRSVLAQIEERHANSDGILESSEPTIFEYQQNRSGWEAVSGYTAPQFQGDYSFETFEFTDLNGDGLTDFFYRDNGIFVYLNNGNGGWDYAPSYQPPVVPDFTLTKDYTLLDINNDGLIDFVRNGVYLNNGDGTWTDASEYFTGAPYPSQYIADIRWADVNGDGLIDVIHSSAAGNPPSQGVYFQTTPEHWTYDDDYIIPMAFSNEDGRLRIFDINGDGLDDIVKRDVSVEDVYLNDGATGFYLESGWGIPYNFCSGSPQACGRQADVNGDGLNDGVDGGYWNQADGTWQQVANGSPVPLGGSGNYYTKFLFDADADGLVDIIDFPGYQLTVYENRAEAPADLLKSITTNKGAVIEVGYTSSTLYTEGGDAANPDLPFSVSTVSSIAVDDGFGSPYSMQYIYAGGQKYWEQADDAFFSGFGKVTKIVGDTKTVTYFHQGNDNDNGSGESGDNRSVIGSSYRTEIRDTTTDELQKQVLTMWSTEDLNHPNGWHNYIYQDQVVTTYFGPTQTMSTAIVNQFDLTNGNLLQENNLGQVVADETTGVISDIVSGDEKSTTYEYAVNQQKYIIGAPKSKVVSGLSEIKSEEFYYNESTMLGDIDKVNLTKEDLLVNAVDFETTFDIKGNPLTQKDPKDTTALDLSYDSYDLYPTTKTDALGRSSIATYDLARGAEVTTVDPNSFVTDKSIDGQNRLAEVAISDAENPTVLRAKELYSYSDWQAPEANPIIDADTFALYDMNGQAGTSTKTDNGVGNPLFDLLENGSPVATIGANGDIDGAYLLDGSSQNLEADYNYVVGDLGNPAGISDFTIEGAFKTSYNGSQYLYLAQHNASEFIRIEMAADTINAAMVWKNYNGDSGQGVVQYSGSYADGNWHTFALVADNGSDVTMRFYLDDTLIGTTVGQNGPYYYKLTERGPFIGSAFNGTAPSSFFHGAIDAFRISLTARDASEITAYRNYVLTPSVASVPPMNNMTASIYFDSAEATTQREYYDALGRQIESKRQTGVAGQYVTIATQYDDSGRMLRQSLPYITTTLEYTEPDFTYSTVYSYDALDRILTETTPTGTTSYSYDGFTTIITDPNNHQKKLTYDAFENLAEVREYNTSAEYITTYEYTLTNKLKKIIDSQGNIRNFAYDDLDNLMSQDMVHKTSVANPVAWNYTHDKNGNVLTKTDPRNQLTTYVYDDLNRILTEDFGGQGGIEYQYYYDEGIDQLNRLSRVVGNNGTETQYTYDYAGRPRFVRRIIDGLTFDLSFEYNLDGAITKITYPEGEQLIYGYNTVGQVDQVDLIRNSVTTTLASNIRYSPTGQISHIERGNGIITDYTYTPAENYRLTRLLSTNGSVILQDINYTYDPAGNITAIHEASDTSLAKDIIYAYDDLNRLISVTVTNATSGINYTRTFVYDSVGNITYQDGVGAYVYNKDNPHQAGQIGGDYYTYDANGNMRFRNNDLHEWDWRDRMNHSRTQSIANTQFYYVYDHNNQRLKKLTDYTTPPPPPPGGGCKKNCPPPEEGGSSGGGGESFLIDPLPQPTSTEAELISSNSLGMPAEEATPSFPHLPELEDVISPLAQTGLLSLASLPSSEDTATYYIDKYYESVYNESSRNHYFLGTVRLATEKLSGTNQGLYYTLTDHVGSSSLTTDETAAITAVSDYYPYGGESYSDTTTDIDDDYTFTGKELDEESGLQYFGARYYDNNVGKWSSIDPIHFSLTKPDVLKEKTSRELSELLENPQILNGYLYANGNPVILTDPDGEIAFLAVVAIAWAVTEFGLSAYDGYDAVTTTIDPTASLAEKGISIGGFALGAVAPGGGYGKAAKEGAKAAKLVKRADTAENLGRGALEGFDLAINARKQAVHLPGSSYMAGKSIVTHSNPQKLIDEFAGTGHKIYNQGRLQKEVIETGQVVGNYIDVGSGRVIETTRATIHYSKNGTHIVPAPPR